MSGKLTAKQQRFIQEYLIDLNATQAAIRAGYSKRRASEIGYQLLQKTTVQQAIAEAMQARSRRTEVTADRVLQEFALLGFADIGSFVDWGPGVVKLKEASALTEEQRRAVCEISQNKDGQVKFKLHDKKGALDSLARHLGMFKDTLGLDVSDNLAEVMKAIAGRPRPVLPRELKDGQSNGTGRRSVH